MPSNLLSLVLRAGILSLSLIVFVEFLFRRRPIRPTMFGIPLLFFLYGVRLLYETQFNASSLGQPASYYWIFFLGATVLPTLAILARRHIESDQTFRMLFVALLASVTMATLQFSTIIDVNGNQHDTGRAALERLNPISFGNIGASLLLLCMWPFLSARYIEWRFRLLLLGSAALGSYALFISASRGPIVGVIVSIALFLASQLLAGRIRTTLLFLVVGVLALAYFSYNNALLDSVTLFRISAVFSNEDMSTSIRLDMYQSGIASVLESPFLGSGIEVQKFHFYPHNLLIEMFMATGIFGGCLSLILIVSVVHSGFRLLKSGHPAGWMALLMIQYLTGAMFSGAVYSNTSFWIAAAMVLTVRFGPVSVQAFKDVEAAQPPVRFEARNA